MKTLSVLLVLCFSAAATAGGAGGQKRPPFVTDVAQENIDMPLHKVERIVLLRLE